MKRMMAILLVGMLSVTVGTGTLVTDPVDDDGTWTLVQGGWQTDPTGPNWPDPLMGDSFYGASWGTGADGRIRGAYKEDIGLTTLQAGETYTVTIHLAEHFDRPFMPLTEHAGFTFGFFDPSGLDFNETDGILGLDTGGNEASVVAARTAMFDAVETFQQETVESFTWVSQPEPDEVLEWVAWTYEFTVGPEDIEGVYFGALGVVYSEFSGRNPAIIFDQITIIPEPATLGMLGFAGLATVLIRRFFAGR